MLAHLATLSEIAVFWVTHLLRPTEEEEEEEQEEKEGEEACLGGWRGIAGV